MFYIRIVLIVVICNSFLLQLFSQEKTYVLSGDVFDMSSNEPLTGATVVLTGSNYYGITGFDGSFVIRNVPAGTYQLQVSFI